MVHPFMKAIESVLNPSLCDRHPEDGYFMMTEGPDTFVVKAVQYDDLVYINFQRIDGNGFHMHKVCAEMKHQFKDYIEPSFHISDEELESRRVLVQSW